MTINIYTDGTITVNAAHVGSVRQEAQGTVLRNTKGAVIALPQNRYALSRESGLVKFKEDLLAALAA
jgi:hypothetical protein